MDGAELDAFRSTTGDHVNDAPSWWPVVLAIVMLVSPIVTSALLLPIVEAIYRAENWLTTCPRPELERAELRDLFDRQLAAFLDNERQRGYRPAESAIHLFGRMLTTLLIDTWDSGHAAVRRGHAVLLLVRVRFGLGGFVATSQASSSVYGVAYQKGTA